MLPLELRDYENFQPGPPTTFLGTRCTCLGKFARVCEKSTLDSFGRIRIHLGEYRVFCLAVIIVVVVVVDHVVVVVIVVGCRVVVTSRDLTPR